MTPAEYKVRFRQQIKVLMGGAAGFAAFFREYPTWKGLMLVYARLAYGQGIEPVKAATDWFNHKIEPQLSAYNLTLDAREGAAARRKAG